MIRRYVTGYVPALKFFMYNEPSQIWCWLAAIVAATCVLLDCIWTLISPQRRARGAGFITRWGLLILAAVTVAELTTLIGVSSLAFRPLLQASLLLGGLGLAYSISRWLHLSRESNDPAPWRAHTVAVISAVALLALASNRFQAAMGPEVTDLTLEDLESNRLKPKESIDYIAYTDLGRAVPLAEFDLDEANQKHLRRNGAIRPNELLPSHVAGRTISRGGADGVGNCHGWVFTGGLFVVSSSTVDQILADNGYFLVDQPQTDDLVVYRNERGEPLHTGVVKAVGGERFVLVEGKWGSLGVFLHLPEEQPYSQSFAYYRSPRSGHLLRVYPALAPNGGEAKPAEPSNNDSLQFAAPGVKGAAANRAHLPGVIDPRQESKPSALAPAKVTSSSTRSGETFGWA